MVASSMGVVSFTVAMRGILPRGADAGGVTRRTRAVPLRFPADPLAVAASEDAAVPLEDAVGHHDVVVVARGDALDPMVIHAVAPRRAERVMVRRRVIEDRMSPSVDDRRLRRDERGDP